MLGSEDLTIHDAVVVLDVDPIHVIRVEPAERLLDPRDDVQECASSSQCVVF